MGDKVENSASETANNEKPNDANVTKTTSSATTPASSVTGVPSSKLKLPSNFTGSTGAISKIGRICSQTPPKAGPPPRDSSSMSRESEDNYNSISSTTTDMYQETIKRFTRSSLSPEMDRFSTIRFSLRSNTASPQDPELNRRRSSNDFYIEATGRRRSSDQGAILTHDTEQFIIGQKVWVGGIRSGQIAYIGETHFAPGEWAGIVLDEPNGKNDGCVAGKRYFQCEPRRGIFSRLTRLTLAPLAGAQTPTSPLQKHSPERSRTGSPTTSLRSSYLGKSGLTVGDRVIVSSGFGSRPGVLRYLGETKFATGNWCGVELDEPTGKNDGSVEGVRYFECKPKYGVFVPIAKVSLSPSSRKARLSRTGSRESLTSIGTMNSIATTNTSRLRMSSQRKSPTVKAVTTPKPQFSMQELLREKQSHIEQLMIERELDREDSQNQALQYQKNINELKTRITQLEQQMIEERKKAEDLQFSIDEATFCGDELNAQTQVYREKIQDLENRIKELTSTNKLLAENSSIQKVETKLVDQSKLNENQKNQSQEDLDNLQEKIKSLHKENENLQKELLPKETHLETITISKNAIANVYHEMDLIKKVYDIERSTIVKDFNVKVEAKNKEIQELSEEISKLCSTTSSNESECFIVNEKCNRLEKELESRNVEIDKLKDQLSLLSSELSMRKAECSTLDEMLKTRQSEETVQYQSEINEAKQNKIQLENANNLLQAELRAMEKELQILKEANSSMKDTIDEITKNDADKQQILNELEMKLFNINKDHEKLIGVNRDLNNTVQELTAMCDKEKSIAENLEATVNEKSLLLAKALEELEGNKNSMIQQETELKALNETSKVQMQTKLQEINELKQQLSELQEKCLNLENESTSTVQQLTAKLNDLENRNKILEEKLLQSDDLLNKSREHSAKHDEVLQAKILELKLSADTLESTNNLVEKLKKDYEVASNNRCLLDQQLKTNEEKISQYELTVSDLERKLETSTKKCDTLTGQNDTLQQDILNARMACSDMQNDLKRLNEDITAKNVAITALETETNDRRIRLEREMEELTHKLNHANKNIYEFKGIIDTLKDELNQKKQQINELEEKCVSYELVISNHLRQQELMQNKHETLLKQNDSLERDINTLRTTTVDSNAELTKLSQEIITQRKTYEDLLDKSNSERATLETELQANHQRVEGLSSQVEMLTEELKVSCEKNLQFSNQLKEQQQTYNKLEFEANDAARKLESLMAKYENLQTQNIQLQNDLSSLRSGSANTNAEIVKLTEELAAKQKALQEVEDKSNSESLAFQSHIQQLQQGMKAQENTIERLQELINTLENTKLTLCKEIETTKQELLSKAQREIEEVKANEALKYETMKGSMEVELDSAEKENVSLKEGVSSLQQKLHLLQEKIQKSQVAYTTKEIELQRQIEQLRNDKEQLGETFAKTKTDNSQALEILQKERNELMHCSKDISNEPNEKNVALLQNQNEVPQSLIEESNASTVNQMEYQKLQNSLEVLKSECELKDKLLEGEQQKVEELNRTIENLKSYNQEILKANGKLCEALESLEHEKCETNNIFELFELESGQNMSKLVETLTNQKQQLNDTLNQLDTMQNELQNKNQTINFINERLQNTENTLNACQNEILLKTTKLQELEQANNELDSKIKATVINAKAKVNEKNITIEKMEDALRDQSSYLSDVEEQLKKLKLEKLQAEKKQKELEAINTTLLDKVKHNTQSELETMKNGDSQKIVPVHESINNVQSLVPAEQAKSINNSKDNKSISQNDANISEDSTAHINFLNSIIADMQKKNDTLKAKIEALEAIPTDFTKPHAFDLIAKRKPAPRVFCDICDEFDKHETEDCPLQDSDVRDPMADKKGRKLPEPRKYCENCEVFGHDTAECDDDECY